MKKETAHNPYYSLQYETTSTSFTVTKKEARNGNIEVFPQKFKNGGKLYGSNLLKYVRCCLEEKC
jgi:hypothetical protein